MNIRSFCRFRRALCTPQPAMSHDHLLNRIQRYPGRRSLVISLTLCFLSVSCVCAQGNVGPQPYFGWSTFSEQTIKSGFLTQNAIAAESDALASSGLQAHGFRYINIDSGWQGSFDSYGRPIPNSATFPDIKALIEHIHRNGQKIGIYWIPGVEYPAVAANSPILGTPYHIQDILAYPTGPGMHSALRGRRHSITRLTTPNRVHRHTPTRSLRCLPPGVSISSNSTASLRVPTATIFL